MKKLFLLAIIFFVASITYAGGGCPTPATNNVALSSSNSNANANSNASARVYNVNHTDVSNSNQQGQNQDQFQGQSQGQTQKMEGSNNANQNINIEATRDFVPALGLPAVNPGFSYNGKSTVLTRGDLFKHLPDVVFYSEARAMAGDVLKNATVTPVLYKKFPYKINNIRTKKVTGDFIGYLYITLDSPAPIAKLQALAMERAMFHAATGIKIEQAPVDIASGDQWSVGFTGAASAVNAHGDIGVAPGGGFGFGKANALTRTASELVVALFHDAKLVHRPDGSLRFSAVHKYDASNYIGGGR